jgi:hypothetical protein
MARAACQAAFFQREGREKVEAYGQDARQEQHEG